MGEARTELGLSQEKLTLDFDPRTILGTKAGRGSPVFENLNPLITYLKIPADKIFYPELSEAPRPVNGLYGTGSRRSPASGSLYA